MIPLDATKVLLVASALAVLPACGSRSGLLSDTTDASVDSAQPQDAGPTDRRLFPIALGRQWTFDSTEADGLSCAPGTTTLTATDQSTKFGLPVFVMETSVSALEPCFEVPSLLYGSDDELRFYPPSTMFADAPPTAAYLDVPVAEGHQWTIGDAGAAAYVWHREDSVTVRAGTFGDCWRRQLTPAASEPHAIVFCRGVGPVKFDGAGRYQTELVSKNF